MNRVRQRCLFVSVMVHISLGLLLIFSPGFSSHDTEVPVLELVPSIINLTDDGKVRGGNPDAAPAPPKNPPAGNPVPVAPPPSDPAPPKPTVADPPKANTPRELDHHSPVSDPEPTPAPEKNQPRELSSHEPVPDKKREADVEPVKPVDLNPSGKHKIEINPEIKHRSSDDTAAVQASRERAENEARERARADAVNRYNQQRQQLASKLGSTASSLSQAVSGAMDIQMPGTGGEVFADYRSYLAAFYKQKWNQHKPGGISVKTASALTTVTIGHDGKVRGYKILESSGLAEIDKTIRLVFERYDHLQSFPSSSKDDERTFTLTFRIESDSSP
jgi:outer membrane biosynthesis protein TonB